MNSSSDDPVASFLEIDVKAGALLFCVFGIVLGLLFMVVVFGSLLDPQPFSAKITPLLFAAGALLVPAALLYRKGLRRRNPMTNKIYAAYTQSPEKIVWVYLKKIIGLAHSRFDIILCDDSGNSRVIPSLQSNYEQRLDAIARRCPGAIMGYQDTWEKLYRRSPGQFIAKVKESIPGK